MRAAHTTIARSGPPLALQFNLLYLEPPVVAGDDLALAALTLAAEGRWDELAVDPVYPDRSAPAPEIITSWRLAPFLEFRS